jgi:hypothetical protein
MSPSMSAAVHVGRLGALAVALGVGAAIASGTAVAWADASGDSGSSTHDTSASASHNRAQRGPSRPSAASAKAAKNTVAPAATGTVSASRVPRVTATAATVPTTGVGGSPTTPAAAPAVWALAAGARREFAPSATARPTAAVMTSPSTLKSTPVGWVTGQANGGGWPQTNNTSRQGVYGTDLGIMWFNGVNSTVQLAFGDTFSGPNQTGDWRSNVLLLEDMTDRNLSNGLTLQNTGYAYQFIPAAPSKVFFIGSEVTNIPSSAVYVNGENYVNYFSVKSWDTPGRWTTNYSAMSKFVPGPNGGNWVLQNSTVRSAGWFRSSTPYRAGDQNFQQAAYVVQPADQVPTGGTQYLYAFGTPSGRAGSAFLSRVAVGSETDLTKYEYWDGSTWVANKPAEAVAILGDSTKSAGLFGFIKDIANNPKFFGGYFAGLTGAKTGGNVSELSVQYNDYLKKYVVLYANGSNNVVLRTADTPEGTWSDPVTIATSLQYPGLYAPMIHPLSGTGQLTDGSGTPDKSNLYWNMSIWGNYNVVLMQTDLSQLKPTTVVV